MTLLVQTQALERPIRTSLDIYSPLVCVLFRSNDDVELCNARAWLTGLLSDASNDAMRSSNSCSRLEVTVDKASLKDLKNYIRELYKPPALGNDGAVLNFMSDEGRYSPREVPGFAQATVQMESSLSLSKPLFVAYEDDKAEKVLGHIIWLLEEAQKPVETSQESKYLHCIYSTSDSEDQINLTKSAIKKNPELLRSNVKMVLLLNC
uniref:Uncharacterized protein n=1 Tax=Rhizophagus irregularis (strain DAOM 181602 / DAOM 197198 / MUCL 43194) TaxID=747089 RepID=U9TZU3_RHIID